MCGCDQKAHTDPETGEVGDCVEFAADLMENAMAVAIVLKRAQEK